MVAGVLDGRLPALGWDPAGTADKRHVVQSGDLTQGGRDRVGIATVTIEQHNLAYAIIAALGDDVDDHRHEGAQPDA